MNFSISLIIALLLDAFFGDPKGYPHPVKVIGWGCSRLEKNTRKIFNNELFAGLVTVLMVLAVTAGFLFSLVTASRLIHETVEILLSVALLSTTVAVNDLLHHSTNVYKALAEKSLNEARSEVGKIVGRDTDDLEREDIAKACVETVAENMVDGITAPIFFACLTSLFSPLVSLSPISCGVIGALLYKAVNTMDSMFGYKNQRYLLFGRTAAKLDDAVNFLPARISGICLIIAVYLLKYDYKKSFKTFLRDRLNHSSPNAGHTEAVVAGALGIELGGPSLYFGNVVDKPTMGTKTRNINEDDILATNRLVVVGSIIFTSILLTARYFIFDGW